MRCHLDNVLFGSQTGPNTFGTRLAQGLWNAGYEIELDGSKADISLVFIESSGKPLAKKVVQRLDGIWFKPQDFHTKNQNIKSLYDRADAVVFQSNFDKNMIERWWGSNSERQRLSPIIGNGIEINPVKEITIPKLVEMRSAYDQIFVCGSNWHPQKRLSANIELFKHIKQTQHPNSCLIVLGNNPDCIVANPHIFYAGSVDSATYSQIYSAANWMFHLAWADHCPNVVIEALLQGTPVVCSNVGGTKELIGHGVYGKILEETIPYNYELFDYDKPPEIDVNQVTFLPKRDELDYCGIPNIDINHVVKQYVELFRSII